MALSMESAWLFVRLKQGISGWVSQALIFMLDRIGKGWFSGSTDHSGVPAGFGEIAELAVALECPARLSFGFPEH